MNQGDLMGLVEAVREWWYNFGLEDACEGVLSDLERERPEYITRIKRWISTGHVPPDRDLQALCRVYQRRLEPR